MFQLLRCKSVEYLKFLFFMKGCSSSQILFNTIYYCVYTTHIYRFSKHSGVSSFKISPLRERMLPPEEVTATSALCRTRERVFPDTSNCSITLPNPSEVLASRASCSWSRGGPSGFYQGDLKVEWIYVLQWRHTYHIITAYSHTAYCEVAFC
jgi:hypothetical protein